MTTDGTVTQDFAEPEQELILVATRLGYSPEQIAKLMEVHYGPIYTFLALKGIKPAPQVRRKARGPAPELGDRIRAMAETTPPAEIADELDCSIVYVYRVLSRMKNLHKMSPTEEKWSREQLAAEVARARPVDEPERTPVNGLPFEEAGGIPEGTHLPPFDPLTEGISPERGQDDIPQT